MANKKEVIFFIWNIPRGHNSLRSRLYNQLFGYYTIKKLKSGENKKYYVDGVLAAWENGKRINKVHYSSIGDSCFFIPSM